MTTSKSERQRDKLLVKRKGVDTGSCGRAQVKRADLERKVAAAPTSPADGDRYTIAELSLIAESKAFNLDQFTRLVIHNGYNEADFDKWLDDRYELAVAQCAKPRHDTDLH